MPDVQMPAPSCSDLGSASRACKRAVPERVTQPRDRTETAQRRFRTVDRAIRLSPLLLIAIAIEPAMAQPLKPAINLQSIDAVRLTEPPSPRNDPALRLRLFQDDSDMVPAWNLPFGSQSERESGGVRFSVRPGRGLKATAKVRF